MTAAGYGVLRAFPTRGNIRLHPFRVAMARYRAVGGHTVISAAPRSILIAFRAFFQPAATGSDS